MKEQSLDRTLAICAILISFISLIMFVYQTNIIHNQSRLSVTPRLGFTTSISQSDTLSSYSIIIKNKGIGPAIIDAFKIIYKDEIQDTELNDFIIKTYPQLKDFGDFILVSNLDEGSTLAPNEKVTLFSYKFKTENREKISTYIGLLNEDELPFNIEIEYSSMYNEKWHIDISNGGHPRGMR